MVTPIPGLFLSRTLCTTVSQRLQGTGYPNCLTYFICSESIVGVPIASPNRKIELNCNMDSQY